MPNPSAKIAEAYVDIRAPADKLASDLNTARTEVESSTAQMGGSVDEHVTKRWQDASSKVTGFVGSVTALLGTAYVFESLGEKISNLVLGFTRASDVAADFRAEIRNLDTAALRAELDGLNDSVTSGAANVADWYHQITDFLHLTEETSRAAKTAIIEAEIAARQALDVQERQVEVAKRLADAMRDIADRRSEIDQANQQMEESLLDGIERIEAQRDRAMRETLMRIAEEEDAIAEARLKYRLTLIDQIAQREIDAFRAAEQEKTRIAQEEAAKRAADAIEATNRVFDAVRQGQGLFSDFAGPIETLADRMEAAIDSARGSIPRRG